MNSDANPKNRLSTEEIANLEVVVSSSMAEDTWLALTSNFPKEQLQTLEEVQEGLRKGWLNLHELRSRDSRELASARLMVVYPARKRTELVFILVAWVVTPDKITCQNRDSASQGKGKGYGSYLRGLSYEISRQQNPHALGLVAERESPSKSLNPQEQSVKRASWMKRIGLLQIKNLDYEIPPLVKEDELDGDNYIPVAERKGKARPADLLLTRFDGKKFIHGRHVHSIVERIYDYGYAIQSTDPYWQERLSLVNQDEEYTLSED